MEERDMSKKTNINTEELAKKFRKWLKESNSYSTGNLLALLGNLAGVSNSLSKVAEDTLYQFYVPTKNARSKYGAVQAKIVLDDEALKQNMNKLGEYRYNVLLEPAYHLRKDTKDVYSDQYLAQKLAKDPKYSAISMGLTTAQYKAQLLDNNDFVLNKSHLISNYLKQGEDLAAKDMFHPDDAEDEYKKLTRKELDDWKAEWEDYYRDYHHQQYLADVLWDSDAVSEEERDYWNTKFGFSSGKDYFIRDWISQKEMREEYERLQKGELTPEEWNDIQKDWEVSTGQPWHPAPELTEKQQEEEKETFQQIWYLDDEGPEVYWKHNREAVISKMNDFFGMVPSLKTGKSEKYLKEQEFLQKLESQDPEKQTKIMSEKETKAQYQQVYELFTKGNFSYLSTKEYLALKQTVKEAASAYVNDKNTPKSKKWAPQDIANDLLCEMMPLFDSYASRLTELLRPNNSRGDYCNILRDAENIASELKWGATAQNINDLIKSLSKCNEKCTMYMQDHPKPSIFRWNANRQYVTIKKLHKEIEKQLVALSVVSANVESKNESKADAAKAKLDADRKAVQEARVQERDLKAQEHTKDNESYKQAQKNIKEGLETVKQMQNQRKAHTTEPKSKVQQKADVPKRRNSMPQMRNGK